MKSLGKPKPKPKKIKDLVPNMKVTLENLIGLGFTEY